MKCLKPFQLLSIPEEKSHVITAFCSKRATRKEPLQHKYKKSSTGLNINKENLKINKTYNKPRWHAVH